MFCVVLEEEKKSLSRSEVSLVPLFLQSRRSSLAPLKFGLMQRRGTIEDDWFRDFVLDQLRELDDVEARGMFGGYGLYQDETFFGIIHKGKLFFKIDESTVREYRRRKMKPFRPNAKQTLKSYYQVPVDIVEDADELRVWAMKAIAVKNNRFSR